MSKMRLRKEEDLPELMRHIHAFYHLYASWFVKWQDYVKRFDFSATQELELLERGFIPDCIRIQADEFISLRIATLKDPRLTDEFAPLRAQHLITFPLVPLTSQEEL